MIVGLTGGIASGKSTVAALFAAHGVAVIDADQVAREVVQPGTAGLKAVVNAFGASILSANGQLDRHRLREIIFADPQQRRKLEGLLHPRIRQAMLEQAKVLQHHAYILFVIPLLVESGQRDMVERVVVVDCPEPQQLQRLMRRDGLAESQARSMLAAQTSRQQRLAIADDIIENSDGAELATRVQQLHQQFLQLESQNRKK